MLRMSRWNVRSLEERFWEKVDKSGTCWLWTARTNRGCYGVFTVNFRSRVLAHRIAYELTHGHIPDGFDICHKCDNPPCVNPDHLFAGTRKQNMEDALSKNRMARGFRLPQTKLSDEQVMSLLSRLDSGKKIRDVALEFGISSGHVSALKRGQFRAMFREDCA